MRVLLVRHGRAGTKERWTGDDRARPLDLQGLRQADALVNVLAPLKPAGIASSPYLRCLQTMAPLAAKLGLPVDQSPSLEPDAGREAAAMVRGLGKVLMAPPMVVCTHGEVLGEVLAALAGEDGLRLRRRPPGPKGCVWVVDFRQGRASSARYIPPGR